VITCFAAAGTDSEMQSCALGRKQLKPKPDQHAEEKSSQQKNNHQDLKELRLSIDQSDSTSYCSKMVG
jgi:hypothetical protein